MYDYLKFSIETATYDETINDLMAAFLADIGFETFESSEKGINAYVRADLLDRGEFKSVVDNFPIDVKFNINEELIKGQDWNREWEQNYYNPIVIGNECVIHSSFHTDLPELPIDIVIDPKMAFGTGHHETTSGMINLLLQEDLKGKSVIDIGTGTGILAILCAKKGAREIIGIDIDHFALENAIENGGLNNVLVNWVEGDVSELQRLPSVDIFLANINLNIIMSDISSYSSHVAKGGKLFLSGFYIWDLPMIIEKAQKFGFKEKNRNVEKNWVAVELEKNE